MESKSINVLVMENNPLLREGLKHVIENGQDMECVGLFGQDPESLEQASRLSPDVVVIGFEVLSKKDIELVYIVFSGMPNASIILLVDKGSSAFAMALVEAGAAAILPRNTPCEDLIQTMRFVSRGYTIIDHSILVPALKAAMYRGHESDPANNFSLHQRELQVLKLAGKGLSNKEIAIQLGISANTVGTHFINVYRKLGVQSRTEAVLFALQNALLSLAELSGDS